MAESKTIQLKTACPYNQKRTRNHRSNLLMFVGWIIEKARELEKIICFLYYTKAFDCVDHKKLENSSRDGNTRQPYLSPEKPLCRTSSNS